MEVHTLYLRGRTNTYPYDQSTVVHVLSGVATWRLRIQKSTLRGQTGLLGLSFYIQAPYSNNRATIPHAHGVWIYHPASHRDESS